MQRIANPSSSNSDARVRVSVSPQTLSPARCGAFFILTIFRISHKQQRKIDGRYALIIVLSYYDYYKLFCPPRGPKGVSNPKPLLWTITADLRGGDSSHWYFQSYCDIVCPFSLCQSIALTLTNVHYSLDDSILHTGKHFDWRSMSSRKGISYFPLVPPCHQVDLQKNQVLLMIQYYRRLTRET